MQNGQHQLDAQSTADIELVQSAKQGDINAFEELVRRHTKRVFAVACNITRSHEDAEEVSQETFLKACCHLKDFEEKAQFSTWLTRIAVNTALSKVRRPNFIAINRDEEPFSEASSTTEDIPDWRPNPEELYGQYQLQQLLREALEQLPPLYSRVFLLRDMHGLSVAETATALQLSIPTVKTRLLRARLQLREILSKSFVYSHVDSSRARAIEPGRRVRPLAAPPVRRQQELQQALLLLRGATRSRGLHCLHLCPSSTLGCGYAGPGLSAHTPHSSSSTNRYCSSTTDGRPTRTAS